MNDARFIDWWSPDGIGETEAAHRRYEKAIQSSRVSALPPKGMGVLRPANRVSQSLRGLAGRGFHVEKPNRDTKLTITLMAAGGLAGCIGVTLYFIVQMAIQIAGWL